MNRVLEIEKGCATVVEKPMPKAAAGFVVVKQHIAPNCIEHRIYKSGFYEFHEGKCHAGHEGVGEVHSVGPGITRWQPGDRVAIFQGWACGDCYVCDNGLSATHCINLKLPKDIEAFNNSESGGNGFCQYRLVPENMLARIPDELSYKYASAANCLIGCTYSPVRDHHVTNEHVCLVGGVGFVGLATLVNLKYRGAKVIVLGRDKMRMDAAMQRFGADYWVNPDDADWLEQVRHMTPRGRGVDFAFECSGYPYYQQRCLDATRHYGHLVLLGYAADEGPELKWDLNTESGLCWGHKHVSAHFDVNINHRDDILRTLCDPWIQAQVDKLVTHTFPMSRAADAFELLINRATNSNFIGKVHFLPGQ